MRCLAIALTLSLLQTVCHAGEQFRCGQWIVSDDVTVIELLKKCGEPTSKTSSSENILARNSAGLMVPVGTTTTEVWTYDRGKRALPMIVTIIDGKLQSMTHHP